MPTKIKRGHGVIFVRNVPKKLVREFAVERAYRGKTAGELLTEIFRERYQGKEAKHAGADA